MNSKPSLPKDPFLRDLELEEERILKKMEELKSELRSISRMKFRRKTQIYGDELNVSVNNKNIDRVFFESIIIQILKESPSGLRTSVIFERISKAGYDINYNTLRSYIVKLRDSSKIKKKSRGYEWTIS